MVDSTAFVIDSIEPGSLDILDAYDDDIPFPVNIPDTFTSDVPISYVIEEGDAPISATRSPVNQENDEAVDMQSQTAGFPQYIRLSDMLYHDIRTDRTCVKILNVFTLLLGNPLLFEPVLQRAAKQYEDVESSQWPEGFRKNARKLFQLTHPEDALGGEASESEGRRKRRRNNEGGGRGGGPKSPKKASTQFWKSFLLIKEAEIVEDVDVSNWFALSNANDRMSSGLEEEEVEDSAVNDNRFEALLNDLNPLYFARPQEPDARSSETTCLTYLRQLDRRAKLDGVCRLIMALHLNWIVENKERKTKRRGAKKDGILTRAKWRAHDYEEEYERYKAYAECEPQGHQYPTAGSHSLRPLSLDEFTEIYKHTAMLGSRFAQLADELNSYAAVILLLPSMGTERQITAGMWNKTGVDATRAIVHLHSLKLDNKCQEWGWECKIREVLQWLRNRWLATPSSKDRDLYA